MVDKSFRVKVGLALLWLVFTGALILWWMFFALGLLKQIEGVEGQHKLMLVLEGTTLMVLLVAGGTTLIYLIIQENRQARLLRDFFSSFSHEIKTALASLRLQAESLTEEDNVNHQKVLLNRLLADVSRVGVSVENSLFVAEGSEGLDRFTDPVAWSEICESLKLSWPQLKIDVVGEAFVSADRRAIMTILNNLIHNATQHGRATEVRLIVQAEAKRVEVEVLDNGLGFSGARHRLGERSFRHQPTSGSGLGLFIVASLLKNIKGQGPFFPNVQKGFCVSFSLPGHGLKS